MKLIVPLINGHMTFRVYCPPAVDGLDAFTDPESLFWQNRFVRYFVKRMKHHPAILAWELGNESNCLSVADTRAAAWNWAAQISASIRLADPSRPVYSGMHSLQLHDRQWETRPNKWLLADQAELCDMLTTHPYQMWRSYVNCDSPNTLRWVMLAPTENRLYADIGGKPAERPVQNGVHGRFVVKNGAPRNIYQKRFFLHFRVFFASYQPARRVRQRTVNGDDVAFGKKTVEPDALDALLRGSRIREDFTSESARDIRDLFTDISVTDYTPDLAVKFTERRIETVRKPFGGIFARSAEIAEEIEFCHHHARKGDRHLRDR